MPRLLPVRQEGARVAAGKLGTRWQGRWGEGVASCSCVLLHLPQKIPAMALHPQSRSPSLPLPPCTPKPPIFLAGTGRTPRNGPSSSTVVPPDPAFPPVTVSQDPEERFSLPQAGWGPALGMKQPLKATFFFPLGSPKLCRATSDEHFACYTQDLALPGSPLYPTRCCSHPRLPVRYCSLLDEMRSSMVCAHCRQGWGG